MLAAASQSSASDLAAEQRAGGRSRRLRRLIETNVPLPARGETRARWRALAAVAEEDLALAKWYESHLDALAILADLGEPVLPGLWGVFAAEAREHGVVARGSNGSAVLKGRKPWCSGATEVDHALVSCQDAHGARRVAVVDFKHPRLGIDTQRWFAAGMSGAATVDVRFEDVPARLIGGPRAYLDRAGFWHGAIGVAACWYGGARGVARCVRDACAVHADAHALAHLGAMDADIQAAAAALGTAADAIDAAPEMPPLRLALAVRATLERTVAAVLERSGRALGAGPLCHDETFARRIQDLSVYVRQSHAERDLAALGQACLEAGTDEWGF